jgi:hypothetical protein
VEAATQDDMANDFRNKGTTIMKIQLARAYTKRMVKKAVRLTEKAILKNLRDTFDRVVLINIPRRDDRLKAALKELTPKRWPFRPPEVFDAMDCFTNRPALYWKDGARAWGRTSDHVMILNKAFNDGVKHLLILDDDFVLTKGFADKIKRFILDCPSDADGYVFGGEHIEKPQEVRTGVVRCHNTQDVLA